MSAKDGTADDGNVIDFDEKESMRELGIEIENAMGLQATAGVEAANRWVFERREKRAQRMARLYEWVPEAGGEKPNAGKQNGLGVRPTEPDDGR